MPNGKEVKIKITVEGGGKAKKEIAKTKQALESFGKKSKVASHDITETVKAANTNISKFGAGVKKTTTNMNKGVKKMSQGFAYHLTFIAWHFRYLGNIFSRIGQQWQRIVRDSINTAAELQESFLSIEVAAAMYGQSVEESLRLTKELALTGLMPLTEAANAVKNLVITGLGFSELEKFSYRYLDVAFLMTSGMDEMQKSLETISKSIMRGTLVLSTDVTARMLWTQTEKRLQRTMGIGMKQLSSRQKLLEVLTTIEENYAKTVGFHEIEQETLRATINRIITSITLLKNAYGIALAPVLSIVADYIKKITDSLLELMPKINSSVALFTVLGLAITTFIGSVSFGIGILVSFYQIFRGLSEMAKVAMLPFSKIALIVLGVSAILAAGTYLILKHTGAWEKMTKSLKGISDKIAVLKGEFEGLQEAQVEGIDEEKAIAHRRRVEDLEEDLNREVSKGLWADQMLIKDLEKRLKREDEDWTRYRDGLEKGDNNQNEKKKTALELHFDKMMEIIEENKQIIADAYGEIGKMSMEEFLKGFNAENLLKGWQEFKRIWSEEIWPKVMEFPPLLKGLLAGLLTYTLIKFIPGLSGIGTALKAIKWSSFKDAALIAFAKIRAAFVLLTATITAPLAISVTVGAAVTAIAMVIDKYKELLSIMEGGRSTFEETDRRIIEHARRLREEGKITNEEYIQILRLQAEAARRLAKGLESAIPWWEKAGSWLSDMIGEPEVKPGFLASRQFGGIVPGRVGQPTPIMAHGGERIVPSRETGGGGNITINFNNPVVRDSSDLDRIAQKVGELLGRKAILAKMGGI